MVVAFDQIEVDVCPACGGLWLDRGELDLLLARGGQSAADWAVEESQPGKRRCPHCRRALQHGPIQGTAIDVDFCPHQHGLWLDKGELAAVIRQRAPPAHVRALLDFCGGVCGEQGG
jgi:Zn-finger nucleic acid-binding protein